jgi:hypothetical protein
MTAGNKLARILATRTGEAIELAFVTEDGRTTRVLASENQIDRLVDELEDVLNSPTETGSGDPPAAA